MAEIVNLNRARKQKARSQKEERAARNRILYGLTKAERQAAKRIKAGHASAVDQHKREKPDGAPHETEK